MKFTYIKADFIKQELEMPRGTLKWRERNLPSVRECGKRSFLSSLSPFSLDDGRNEGHFQMGLPDMMSASQGRGQLWKSGCSKGGCLNFLYKSDPHTDKGGRGSKIQKC